MRTTEIWDPAKKDHNALYKLARINQVGGSRSQIIICSHSVEVIAFLSTHSFTWVRPTKPRKRTKHLHFCLGLCLWRLGPRVFQISSMKSPPSSQQYIRDHGSLCSVTISSILEETVYDQSIDS